MIQLYRLGSRPVDHMIRWITKFLFAASALLFFQKGQAANRYWVFKNFYDNHFSTTAALNDWQLVEDDGTGSFTLSAQGTGILMMDDAAGGYASRLFNINGGSPRFVPLDAVNGQVEMNVLSLTGGNQLFFLQAQEFDGTNNYLGQVNILSPQNTTGYFTVRLNTVTWDPATVSVRFIIGGENFSAQQGTVEFGYFSYSTNNNSWSNPSNWSALSGGAGGASAPGPADIAVFDGAGNDNGSCLTDVNINVLGLQIINGYSGDLDLNGFQLMTGNSGLTIGGGGISQETNNIVDNGDLTITGGAFSNVSGTCFVKGNVQILAGTVQASNTILELSGITDQSVLFGTGIILNEIHVNKPSGDVNLASDVQAINFLSMIQGNVNTNGFNLILGFNAALTGTLNYTGGRIDGSFRRWISSGATPGDMLFPLGNTVAYAPFTVKILTAPVTAGTITLQYNDAAPGFTTASFLDNLTPILAISNSSWTVSASGITGGNFSLSAADDHVAGISDYTKLHMTLASGVVGSHVTATGSNTDPTINRSALTSATLPNTFFMGAESSSLPVTLLRFSASYSDQHLHWTWTVSQEENLAYYEPEYSLDGTHFLAAGKVAARNLSTEQSYEFETAMPLSGNLYCRLKSVDLDGRYYLSLVALITASVAPGLAIWPNPASDVLNIQHPAMAVGPTSIRIIDGVGKTCVSIELPVLSGTRIGINTLAAGRYYLTLRSASGELLGIKTFIKR